MPAKLALAVAGLRALAFGRVGVGVAAAAEDGGNGHCPGRAGRGLVLRTALPARQRRLGSFRRLSQLPAAAVAFGGAHDHISPLNPH
jgi:hypothetical protein